MNGNNIWKIEWFEYKVKFYLLDEFSVYSYLEFMLFCKNYFWVTPNN